MAEPVFETRAPAPDKPRVSVDAVGDELVLGWRSGTSCGGFFLLVWLTGWSAGCGMLLRELLTKFEWMLVLFATPFFAAWVAVACVVVVMLFGRQRLVISRRELSCTSSALVTYYRRVVPLQEVARASVGKKTDNNSDGPPITSNVVRIDTLGQPVRFAKGIAQAEAIWLAETINVCLDRLAPDRAALTTIEYTVPFRHNLELRIEDNANQLAESENENCSVVVFEPGRDRYEQPSDSRWRLSRGGRATQFTCRGRLDWGAIGLLTFFNLFWNGIVGVFLCELMNDFQWFLAVFLIPFEVIGLLMLLTWIGMLTAPLWVVRHSIRFGRVERLVWGPLYRSRHEWEFDRLHRIEISEPGFTSTTIEIPPKRLSNGDFRVALVDTNDQPVASIDAVTSGEALWMADVLMYEHPDMFRRRR